MFTLDPNERITADEALKDPWIVSEGTRDINLAPTISRGFSSRRTLKSLVNVVAVLNRLKLDHLKEAYADHEDEDEKKSDSN
jgi:calcium/calmodulin-dependent protein kinase I